MCDTHFTPVYMSVHDSKRHLIERLLKNGYTYGEIDDIDTKRIFYQEHIEHGFCLADSKQSSLPSEVFDIYGHSGVKTRCFYNYIGKLPDMRYLEIGCLHGSSTCSMLKNNNIDCVCIDNFSEFEGTGIELHRNLALHTGDNNVQFINQDCWTIDPKSLGKKFNVYLYDGPHEETEHYTALNHYLPCLDDVFIYIIDDWNWLSVRTGTLDAIKNNDLDVLYKKEIRTTMTNTQPEWNEYVWPRAGPTSDWHNGLCVFILSKNKKV